MTENSQEEFLIIIYYQMEIRWEKSHLITRLFNFRTLFTIFTHVY